MGSLEVFRKTPHKDTFGVEIECYPNSTIEDEQHVGFFWCTRDGSLSSSGREFVSQPLPYDFLHNRINWLHKKIGGWYVRNECGLHIHVSRKMWSAQREDEFSNLLCALTSEQTKAMFGRVSNTYTNPNLNRGKKYRAINCLHPNSYEFRLWAAGDLTWTLEALRRTREIVMYRGKYTYENVWKLCFPNKKLTADKPKVSDEIAEVGRGDLAARWARERELEQRRNAALQASMQMTATEAMLRQQYTNHTYETSWWNTLFGEPLERRNYEGTITGRREP